MNAQLLEFVGKGAMTLRVEQLVVAREHKEHPNRDAVEGERDVSPSDTIEQYVHHRCCSFPRRDVGPGAAIRVGSRGSLREECRRFYGKTKSRENFGSTPVLPRPRYVTSPETNRSLRRSVACPGPAPAGHGYCLAAPRTWPPELRPPSDVRPPVELGHRRARASPELALSLGEAARSRRIPRSFRDTWPHIPPTLRAAAVH